MTGRRTSLALVLTLALLAGAGTALAARASHPAPALPPSATASIASAADTHTVVVAFRPGTDTAKVSRRHSDKVSSVGAAKKGSRTRRVKLSSGTSLETAITELSSDPDVLWAEPLIVYRASAVTPTDPLYSSQWGMGAIHAPDAWGVETGSTHAITIAVIDTGIDATRPDLTSKTLVGYNWVSSNTNTTDDNGHGSHVAGIAAGAANNGVGIAGVSWGARLLPLKVLDSTGSGYSDNIAAGIRYAADSGARVANLSLGATVESLAVRDAVTYATSRGCVVIAAAGNFGENGNPTCYPAAQDGVIGVASVGRATFEGKTVYTRSRFSEYGAYVDVAAPGEKIISTMISSRETSGFSELSGTSMATPFVSGAAALLLSARPELNPKQVESLLCDGASDIGAKGKDDLYGAGLLDIASSLELATRPVIIASTNPASEPGWTNTTAVTAAFSAPGATEYRVSEDASLTGAPWTSVAPTSSLTLSSGDGTKTVFAQFRSSATPVTSTYQEGDSHIALSPLASWVSKPLSKYSGGAQRSSSVAGSSATVTFRGSAIKWIGAKTAKGGIARVSVDGVPQTLVDCYSRDVAYQQVLYSKTGLSRGSHTLIIEVLSDKNSSSAGRDVALDAVEVTDDTVSDPASVAIVLDTVAPEVPVIESPAMGAGVSNQAFLVKGTSELSARVQVRDDLNAAWSRADSHGHFSLVFNTNPGFSGLRGLAADSAGNLSGWTASLGLECLEGSSIHWKLEGPPGGDMWRVAASSLVTGPAYFSTASTLYRVAGSGQIGVPASNGLGGTLFTPVVSQQEPNSVRIDGAASAFWRTDNGGATWRIEHLTPATTGTGCLTWPSTDLAYALGATAQSLYVIDSRGNVRESRLPTTAAWAIAVDPKVPTRVVTVSATTSTSVTVMDSRDSAVSWATRLTTLPYSVSLSTLLIDPADPDVLIGSCDAGVVVLTRASDAWVGPFAVKEGGWAKGASLLQASADGSVLYAKTPDTATLFQCTETSRTLMTGKWQQTSALLHANMAAGVNGTVFTSGNPPKYSVNNGATWLDGSMFARPGQTTFACAPSSSTVDLIADGDGRRYARSRASNAWASVNVPGGSQISADQGSGRIWFLGGGLFSSSDSGKTGSVVTTLCGDITGSKLDGFAASPYQSGYLVAWTDQWSTLPDGSGSMNTVVVSTDGGMNWRVVYRLPSGYGFSMPPSDAIAFDPVLKGRFQINLGWTGSGYAIESNGSSSTMRPSWTPTRIVFDPSDQRVRWGASADSWAPAAEYVYLSRDNGSTWSTVTVQPISATGQDSTTMRATSGADGQTHVYVGTNSGLMRSADDGATWSMIGLMPSTGGNSYYRGVRQLQIQGGRVYLSSDNRGVFSFPDSFATTAPSIVSATTASGFTSLATTSGVPTQSTFITADGRVSVLAPPAASVGVKFADGRHTLTAYSTDFAGNDSAESTPIVVTIDTTPPETTLTCSPTAPTGSSGRFGVWRVAPSVSLSAVDAVTGVGTVRSGWDTTASFAPYAGPFTAPEGRHTLWLSSVDATGNTEVPTPVAFDVDTTPPSASISSPLPASTLLLPTLLSGTATDRELLGWRLELGRGSAPTTFTTLAGAQGVSAGQPAYLLDPSHYAAGTYTLRLSAEDLAGNTASTQILLTLGFPKTARWTVRGLENDFVSLAFDESGCVTDWRRDIDLSGTPSDDPSLLRGSASFAGVVLDSDLSRSQAAKATNVVFEPYATATEVGQRISFDLAGEGLAVTEVYSLTPATTAPSLEVTVRDNGAPSARRVSFAVVQVADPADGAPDDLELIDSMSGDALPATPTTTDATLSAGSLWAAYSTSALSQAAGLCTSDPAVLTLTVHPEAPPFERSAAVSLYSDSTPPVPGWARTSRLGLVSGSSTEEVAEIAAALSASFAAPELASLSASQGAPGTPVTLTGTHFGTTQGAGLVTFAGVPATVTSWSDSSITCLVPDSAAIGYVGVWRAGICSNGAYFVPGTPPALDALPSDNAPAGSTLHITGTGFGSVPAFVTFAGVPATVTAWSDNAIDVTVPVAPAGYLGVWKGGLCSNGRHFTPGIRPTLVDVDPYFATPGSLITLSGTDFGTATGRVTLAGESCAIVTWSPTVVLASVPPDAVSGYLGVWSGGLCSNGVWFEVVR